MKFDQKIEAQTKTMIEEFKKTTSYAEVAKAAGPKAEAKKAEAKKT